MDAQSHSFFLANLLIKVQLKQLQRACCPAIASSRLAQLDSSRQEKARLDFRQNAAANAQLEECKTASFRFRTARA